MWDIVKHYLYKVTLENYRGDKFIGRSTVQVTAPHCSVAARKCEKCEGGVESYAVDVERMKRVTNNGC